MAEPNYASLGLLGRFLIQGLVPEETRYKYTREGFLTPLEKERRSAEQKSAIAEKATIAAEGRKSAQAKVEREAEEEDLAPIFGPLLEKAGIKLPKRPDKVVEDPFAAYVPGKQYLPKGAITGLSELTKLVQGPKPLTKPEALAASAAEEAGPGATPAQVGDVLRRRDIEDVGKKAASRKEEVMDIMPAGAEWLNPETLEPFPAGTSQLQARQAGGIQSSAVKKPMEELGKLQSINNMATTLKTFSVRLHQSGEGFFQRGLQAADLTRRAWSDTDVMTYEGEVGAFLGRYARGVSAEVGVLNEGDIRRIAGMFPGRWDSAISAGKKWAILDTILEDADKMQRDIIRGKVPRADPAYRTKLEARLKEIEKLDKDSRKGVDEGKTPIAPVDKAEGFWGKYGAK